MNNVRPILYCALPATLAVWFSCSIGPLAAGGTDTETGGTIAGVIKTSEGTPAAHTMVSVVPSGYNPVASDPLPDTLTVSTDTNGAYRVHVRTKGVYNIQAVNLISRNRLLLYGITYADGNVQVQPAVLSRPSSLRLTLPDGIDRVNGFIFIPGTTIKLPLSNTGAAVVVDSVPSGTIPAVMYFDTISSQQRILRRDVNAVSERTSVIVYPLWAFARNIYLNTTQSGAGVMNSVVGFPVLLRLNAHNFTFAQARHDGNDLRFTQHDSLPVPYEIEQWDSANGAAALWVKIDTVRGNDSSQSITMFWGNPNAAGTSNGAKVFDTANGFQGVWHLSEPGNTTVYDATVNKYNGTPSGMDAASAVPGIIGAALQFDGAASSIEMLHTSASKLNFPQDGYYTISAWVNADTLDENWQFIVGKGHEQYYLKQQTKSTYGNWEFIEYHDKAAWQITEVPVVVGTWKYLAGVRQGNKQYLYLDGQLVDSTMRFTYDSLSRNTSADVTLGRYQSTVTYKNEGYCFFKGKIDEVRISNVSRNADWINLCFLNQKDNERLVMFK